MTKRTFADLAKEISDLCDTLDTFVGNHEELGAFEPSFSDYNSWRDFINCLNINGSHDEKDARTKLLDKTADLRDIVLGPAGMVVWPALTYPYQLSTLKILNDFSIPQIIPLDKPITFSEITQVLTDKISEDLDRRFTMSEDFVTRVIRHASTFHILAVDEDTKTVSHTAPSQAFLDNPIPPFAPLKVPSYSVKSTLTICLDPRFLSTAFRIGDALLRYGDIVEPYETAFNLAFDTPYDYLRYMADDANLELCETMLDHLTFVMSSHNMATRDHDQDKLAQNVIRRINSQQPQPISKVVDMGGGWGDVCISIAKDLLEASTPLPQFVVADLERMITNGKEQLKQSKLDEKIKEKITFERYNFIDDIYQPDDADIYMFRFVMHDWSDSRVITILNNIVFNMKKDACILIMDYIIPKQHVFPLVVERLKRTMDMAAMSILAGKERTEDDWVQLIARFNKENPKKRLVYRLCTDDDPCTNNEPCTDNKCCKGRHAFGVVELTLASS